MPNNVNTEFYDKTVDRAAMIRLYEKRVSDKVELLIDGHTVKVERLIENAKKSDVGFNTLREAIDQDIQRTYKRVYNTAAKELIAFATDEYNFVSSLFYEALNRIWKVQKPERRIPEEIVLKRPIYSEQTLENAWKGVAISERKRIEALIRRGLSEGLTSDQIAKELRKSASFNISKYHSRAIVTTAITSVKSQVDQAVYSANGKAIRGWQYVAVLDSRTTTLCAHRNGSIYPIDDIKHLPPAHYNCRSTTVPVFKSWEDIANLEAVAEVRRRNIKNLSDEEIAFYDGQTPMQETYHQWLSRQSKDVQLKHLGDYQKLELFRTGKIHIDKFHAPDGVSIGISELRAKTDSGLQIPNDTKRFAVAKERLDAMQLGAANPDDFINDANLTKTLKDYYILQTKELDGILSLTNYRGTLIGSKKGVKRRVLTHPPREDQVVFNPVSGRYEDSRLYRPNPKVLENAIKLVDDSDTLLDRDKVFIKDFIDRLDSSMSINERAVVTENLRNLFGRFRNNGEVWGNFKAVAQGQIKFDVMNISDNLETQVRKDSDALKKLLQNNYIDPVLGPTQLQDIHDKFIPNILARNNWEDKVAPKIARELRSAFHNEIPAKIHARVNHKRLDEFYVRLAHRLSVSEMPDRDQLAVDIGRDLHNLASLNGDRHSWYKTGMKILESNRAANLYEIETFGVQKRRMRSRISGKYFGPYYDTISYNIRIVDPRLQEYAKLNRSIDLGLRTPVLNVENQLKIRPGFKTYFIDRGVLGWEDTRIPITSTSSFSDFPTSFIDKDFADAMNWTGQSKYKIDEDYYDFVKKLLYFKDDKGKAQYYDERNEYRKYIASRSDTYERFKAIDWLREKQAEFSNIAFIDHRGRIYERGFIGPQAGETFRPFLNTHVEKELGVEGYNVFKDQVGNFLGGISDKFEGRYNAFTFSGRQKIADKWWPELVEIGNHMLKGKPNDIRKILDKDIVKSIDGDELGKFFRFAIESAKIDNYLEGNRSVKNLEKLNRYKTALALEQDASASGAQIVALTTRNKELAELSNVIPTTYKKRLYDEVSAATFGDPRFKKLNEKLGLTEKDLRKAAKYSNMVTLYGAGERTAGLQVEKYLAKPLQRLEGVLVVSTLEKEQVLSEISARMARYERFDPDTYEGLKELRKDVKDIFDKGLKPSLDLLDELYFLNSETAAIVDKMTASYDQIITANDFKEVATIINEKLSERAPILKDFTKYFGNLAADFVTYAKPKESEFDWKETIKTQALGVRKKGDKKGFTFPNIVNEFLGFKRGEPISEKILKRFDFWSPSGTLSDIIYGVESPKYRRTGAKYFSLSYDLPAIRGENKLEILPGIKIFSSSKKPKNWNNIPWINFDGKTLEQHFTQTFEEKLVYKDKDENWTTNILNVPQKTSLTWWEEVVNKKDGINDIADIGKAKTAFAVNGNHANDATIVKNFHLWGLKNNVGTSTIHDAFFTNISDMMKARLALREIFSKTLDINIIEELLREMKARGFPEELYQKYLDEAISKGLIPVSGRSKINNKVMTESDILSKEDILKQVPRGFDVDYGWYGIG
jgi:SPP1 gp7 family putative phage head morphogenesis protein